MQLCCKQIPKKRFSERKSLFWDLFLAIAGFINKMSIMENGRQNQMIIITKEFKLTHILITAILISALGCSHEKTSEQVSSSGFIVLDTSYLYFKNEKYGFSFSYPSEWEEIKRDLPDKWAILDKDKNTILFIVNNETQTNNILVLGRLQAIRDMYPDAAVQDLKNLSSDKLQKIKDSVSIGSFNNITWYSYGIMFSEKNVNSMISGTICRNNEIMLVLVSDIQSFEKNKEVYTKVLNSFNC